MKYVIVIPAFLRTPNTEQNLEILPTIGNGEKEEENTLFFQMQDKNVLSPILLVSV